jgi:hypothetical protein
VNDTSYAVGLQIGRLRTVMAGFACGSMVLFSFFVKKDRLFRPAGGDVSFRVNDRVSHVNETWQEIMIGVRQRFAG